MQNVEKMLVQQELKREDLFRKSEELLAHMQEYQYESRLYPEMHNPFVSGHKHQLKKKNKREL